MGTMHLRQSGPSMATIVGQGDHLWQVAKFAIDGPEGPVVAETTCGVTAI